MLRKYMSGRLSRCVEDTSLNKHRDLNTILAKDRDVQRTEVWDQTVIKPTPRDHSSAHYTRT